MIVLDPRGWAGGKMLALAADMGGPKDGDGRLIAADIGRDRLASQCFKRAARARANVETRLLDPGKELVRLLGRTSSANS